MTGKNWRLRVAALLAGTTIWMGAGCPSLAPFEPPATSVVIEMLNFTDFPIEPRLFVDPTPGILAPEQLIRDENFVLVDPPLAPGELATFEFLCEDVGTMASDHAELLISDTEFIPSDNGPLLVQGSDFFCGDTITLNFIDDGTVFFTRVEVNGRFLTD